MILLKNIKQLEDSDVIIDGITETVEDEMKKQEGGSVGGFVSTFSRFISTTRNFFSNKKYKWKRI